jgi:hypothetical protein
MIHEHKPAILAALAHPDLPGVSPEFAARLSAEDLGDIAAGDIPVGTVQAIEGAAIAREAEDRSHCDARSAAASRDTRSGSESRAFTCRWAPGSAAPAARCWRTSFAPLPRSRLLRARHRPAPRRRSHERPGRPRRSLPAARGLAPPLRRRRALVIRGISASGGASRGA